MPPPAGKSPGPSIRPPLPKEPRPVNARRLVCAYPPLPEGPPPIAPPPPPPPPRMAIKNKEDESDEDDVEEPDDEVLKRIAALQRDLAAQNQQKESDKPADAVVEEEDSTPVIQGMTEQDAEEKEYAKAQLMSMIPSALRGKARKIPTRPTPASKPLVSVPGPRLAGSQRTKDDPETSTTTDESYEHFMSEMKELGAM